MHEITAHGFDHGVRDTLRYSHKFEPHKMDLVRGLYDHALGEIDRPTLSAKHFGEALKAMEEHPDWKKLSEGNRGAVVSTLKQHLGIVDN